MAKAASPADNRTYQYRGVRFRQSPEAPSIVAFVAPADEIVEWAGVPQKNADFIHVGFQRALDPSRQTEITTFFDNENNASPTSVVLSLDSELVRILPKTLGEKSSLFEDVEVRVESPLLNLLSTAQLATRLRDRLEVRTKGSSDDEFDEPEDGDGEQGLEFGASHLKRFVEQLVQVAESPDQPDFRKGLTNLLKPAMIVDGQHRLMGAAACERKIPFMVCALEGAPWPEQVFQFVVINQKAKPIEPKFLSAIVNSSLTAEEMGALSNRLIDSGIKLEEYETINLLQNDPASPFRNLIDQKIPGVDPSSHYLPYVTMRKLAYRFKKSNSEIYKKFGFQVARGASNSEKQQDWSEDLWTKYFFAFWAEVRERYQSDDPGTDLWTKDSQLMQGQTMLTLQELFVEELAVINGYTKVKNVSDFRDVARKFLEKIPKEFFLTKWGVTQLTAGDGPQLLRDAMTKAKESGRWRMMTLIQGRRT